MRSIKRWDSERICESEKKPWRDHFETKFDCYCSLSDPCVYLERMNIGKTKHKVLQKRRKNSDAREDLVKSLAREGNEGLKYGDPYTCCLCRKVFSGICALKQHLMKVHCGAKILTCDLCSMSFLTKAAIAHHMIAHSQKQFCCNICAYRTSYKQNYLSHCDHIFRKCSKCDYFYRKEKELKRWVKLWMLFWTIKFF